MNVLLQDYSKKTIVKTICLNKEFVIVIALHDFRLYITWNLLTSTSYKYSDSTIFHILRHFICGLRSRKVAPVDQTYGGHFGSRGLKLFTYTVLVHVYI